MQIGPRCDKTPHSRLLLRITCSACWTSGSGLDFPGLQQLGVTVFEVARAAVDQAKVLVEVAARAAVAADLERLLELRDGLLPVTRGGRRDREIAQRLGAVRDLALLLREP